MTDVSPSGRGEGQGHVDHPRTLPIEGELPGDLDGVYALHGLPRVDGEGPSHRVMIRGGRARYDTCSGRSLLVRQETFSGQIGLCDYPKIDLRTGETLAGRADSRPPFLTWTVIRPDGTGTPPRPVEGVARPSVIHDMAITERYVVLVVAPWFVDGSGGSRVWDARAGARIALVPRDGGLEPAEAEQRRTERAMRAGARCIEDPVDTFYGDRRAMVEDPYGNVFQIAHRG